MPEKKFRALIERCQRDVPENFQFRDMVVETDFGQRIMPVILGEHPMKRIRQRSYLTLAHVFELAKQCIEDPECGAYITRHSVFWDDERKATFPDDEDGIRSTAVMFPAEEVSLIFESGFSYIRVKTVWIGPVNTLRRQRIQGEFLCRNGKLTQIHRSTSLP